MNISSTSLRWAALATTVALAGCVTPGGTVSTGTSATARFAAEATRTIGARGCWTPTRLARRLAAKALGNVFQSKHPASKPYWGSVPAAGFFRATFGLQTEDSGGEERHIP